MKQKNLISIICPIYNGSEIISSLINSIIKQSYKNYELILINGGSTNNTKEIIKISRYNN